MRWTARILALLLTAIFLAFVAGEPVGSFGVNRLRDLAGMAFLFAAVGAMLLAWEWEFPLALGSLFSLAAFTAVVQMRNYAVVAILALPNLFYLLDWKLRRSARSDLPSAG